jgi:hypothetical protein
MSDELDVMSRMILALPPQLRAAVAEVFCDSKATHSYLRHWSLAWAIAKRLDAAATKVCCCHNGLTREIVPPQACASPSILVGKRRFECRFLEYSADKVRTDGHPL